MPPLVSASKATRALLSRTHHGDHHFQKYVPGVRSLSSSIAPGVNRLVNSGKQHGCSVSNYNTHHKICQMRGFIGCGDGEEGSVHSKVHKENRVLGYTPEQLFAVVAAVDMYEDFLPWCQRSKIVQRNQDGSFDAELEIGFKFFVESYMSRVDLNKPKSIKTTASESNLFDHLINQWEFRPGPVPGSCDLYFLVDFKFQSPLYGQSFVKIEDRRFVITDEDEEEARTSISIEETSSSYQFNMSTVASLFFKEVVSRLVQSFSDRCQLIYGPGVQVIENEHAE